MAADANSLPYGQQTLDDDDIAAVIDVLRSDWLTTGPAVAGFEDAIAQAGETHHAVAVSSGTAALHAAYAACGVEAGCSIVTSPLSFASTATAAVHLGARVRFADIDPDTGNLDPAAAATVMAHDTRLIVTSDYAGHPADYAAIGQLAESRDILLCADAAHSFGARIDGRAAASRVDLSATSFHPVKAITTAEGGALLTSRSDIADRARAFRNHGIVRERDSLRRPGQAAHYYEIQSLGLNYRLPDVLAALGQSQIKKLGSFLGRRSAIAAKYSAALAGLDSLQLPVVRDGVEPAWHLYVVRVRDSSRRDPVFDGLREAGLGVQVHYPPIHTHPVFEALGYARGQFPVTEDFSARAISLPLFPAMTDDDVERVIETVTSVARSLL